VLGPKHPFLAYFIERVGRKRLIGGPYQQEGIVRFFIQSHPFALGDGAGAEALPMHLAVTDPKAANFLEEEQRNRALQPFVEVLLQLAAEQRVRDGYFDTRGPGRQVAAVNPMRLSEPRAIEGNGECWCEKLDSIAQAESALEPNPPKPD